MSDKGLHTGFKLTFVPRLSVLRRRLSGENGSFDAGCVQHGFEPPRHVTLLRVRSIYLDGSPILGLRLNHLDESALLRVEDGLIEIWRVRNQEAFALFGLLVVGNAPDRKSVV